MDTKLKDGNVVCTPGGALETISGEKELLQRAAMRLCTRRGAFVYAPAFGSRLAGLSAATAGAGQQALQFAQEALAPVPSVKVVAAQPEQNGVRVKLAAGAAEIDVLVPYDESGVSK